MKLIDFSLTGDRLAILSLKVILYLALPASFLLFSTLGIIFGAGFQNSINVTLSFFAGVLVGFYVGSLILILWVRVFASRLGLNNLSDLIDGALPEKSPVFKLVKGQLKKLDK